MPVMVIKLQGRNPRTGTWWHPRHKVCRSWRSKRTGKFHHWHVEW